MILVRMKDDRPKFKKPHKLLQHLNPTVGGAQQSPPHKTLNQNNCAN
jgi:hypothetical protein